MRTTNRAQGRLDARPQVNAHLTTWLVESSLELQSSGVMVRPEQAVIEAIREIVPGGVVHWKHDLDSGSHEPAISQFPVGSSNEVHAPVLEINAPNISPDVRHAISLFLSIAQPYLSYPADRLPELTGNHKTAISDLLKAVEGSERRGELLERLGSRCLEIFSCDAVAILRGAPMSILRAWVRDPANDILSDLKLIRDEAAPLWRQCAGTQSPVTGTANPASGSLEVHISGVRLTRDDSEPLALFLYPHRSEAAPDVALLDLVGDELRHSRHFQSIVDSDVPGYSFLDALSDVTLAAASTHDLGRLYEAVRQSLAKVLPLDAMLIAMILPGEEDGIAVYRNERATSYMERTPLSAPFQSAIRLGQPFVVDEVPEQLNTRDYRFGDASTRVRSLAGAPLIANGFISGLIVVQSYDSHAFSVQDSNLLLDIGRAIAVALERAELIDRLRRRSLRETTLRTVTERLSSTFDTREMLEIVVSEMSALMTDSFIAAVSADSSTPSAATEIATRGPDTLRSLAGIDADAAIIAGGPVATAMEARELHYTTTDGRSITMVPLLSESGAMVVVRPASAMFVDEERTMLLTLSQTLASSLRNSRLYGDRSRQERDLLEVQRISRLVASSLDAETVLNEIISSLPQLFNSQGCSVRIVDGDDLIPLAVHGDIVQSFAPRVPIATALAGRIVREKRVVAVHDLLSHHETASHANRTGVKVRGWVGAPMIDAEGEVIGILSIHSDHPRAWTERDIVLLQTLAGSTTVAIQNAWRFSRTRDVLLASIESLANAVDAKDPTTLNHSRNVSDFAREIASAMGCPEQEVETIALAGLLHDVGKIGIPDRILQKPDSLDNEEWERMKTHPTIGEQILSGNPHLAPVLALVRHHHERWDGGGYPDGLEGEEIPLGAAIVALADAVDTMASDRPYRAGLDWSAVCDIVRDEAGKQFHPEAARCFLSQAEAGHITRPRYDVSDAAPSLPPGISAHGHSMDARALMIFHGVSREVRALTDLDTFVANITRVLRGVLELTEIQIFLSDDDLDEIVYRATPEDRLRGAKDVRRRRGDGVVGWVVQHGERLLVHDAATDNRFIRSPNSNTRSELAVPLIADGAVIGAINIESPRVAAFSESDERLLSTTAAHLAQTIQVARLHDRLKQLASTDALTGLANHRAFYERLDEEIRHASATDGVLSVAIMDVDQLKQINDDHGHLAGDAVLREIAKKLKERCRRSDFVSRYGGDEFAFILADRDLADAGRAIENIVSAIGADSIAVNGRALSLPTGAWGMASYPDDGARSSELVRVADLRMYSRKRYRRNENASLQD